MKNLLILISILALTGCEQKEGLQEQNSEAEAPLVFSDLKFKNGYDLFRSIDTSYPELETSTRTMGTLGTSGYMATTKIFQSDVSNNEIKELSDNIRAYLVKSLKKALGNDYCGGLVPDYVSINNYPNELTFMSTDPNDYLNHIKESSICIYTKGLQNSPARKLPEYLSQGKCIVSERMETELPHNLEEGKHIFFYDNINECINICEKLLKDGELVQQVSKNARRYYEDYLDPVSVGKSIIQHLENEV
jgi:hypothetical protein